MVDGWWSQPGRLLEWLQRLRRKCLFKKVGLQLPPERGQRLNQANMISQAVPYEGAIMSKEVLHSDDRDIHHTTHKNRSEEPDRGMEKYEHQSRGHSKVIVGKHGNNQKKKTRMTQDCRRKKTETQKVAQSDLNASSSLASCEASNERGKNDSDSGKPNFGLSGKLTEDTNTYKGVVIRYTEPPESRKPKKKWRLYPFKGDTGLPVLHLHRQSAFLIGRDRRVADIPSDHPSCSKQHAVLQFRMVDFSREDGTTGRRVRPYIIDLGSANGTYVNNNKIDSERYVELLERDVLKFGYSTREYVMLLDTSDTTTVDEDDCSSAIP